MRATRIRRQVNTTLISTLWMPPSRSRKASIKRAVASSIAELRVLGSHPSTSWALLNSGEQALQAHDALGQSVVAEGVREAQKAARAERLARHHSHVGLLENQVGQ